MQIVDFFYNIARENLRVKTFVYGKAYAKGAGSDKYPLIWLDDPIYGQTAREGAFNALQWITNVDILGIPTDEDNVVAVQNLAFTIGTGIVERAKKIYGNTGLTFLRMTFTSLRHYYDDKAAGWRFTYTISAANPVDRCLDDYDPDKVLENPSPLPQFLVENPDGCAVFNRQGLLPDFSVAP